MYVDFDSAETFVDIIRRELGDTGKTAMVLVSDHHLEQVGGIIDGLNQAGITFFGAIFPGLIHQHRHQTRGAILNLIDTLADPVIIPLSEAGPVVEGEWPEPSDRTSRHTAYLFCDCFSPRVKNLLDILFDHYGSRLEYFGAGAGDRALSACASVFSNAGLFAKAGVFCIETRNSHTAVRHGWQHLTGPFIATRTRGSHIIEFDWKNAGEVYLNVISSHSSGSISQFSQQIASRFPLAIQMEGAEDVIRDPVALTESGEIVCLTEIPQNQVMYMVQGEPQWLIDAAAKATEETMQQPGGDYLMVADCFSRTLALGNRFEEELRAANERARSVNSKVVMEGVIALGEICSSAGQSLQLYNKTFIACRQH